jgi:serine protease Do
MSFEVPASSQDELSKPEVTPSVAPPPEASSMNEPAVAGEDFAAREASLAIGSAETEPSNLEAITSDTWRTGLAPLEQATLVAEPVPSQDNPSRHAGAGPTVPSASFSTPPAVQVPEASTDAPLFTTAATMATPFMGASNPAATTSPVPATPSSVSTIPPTTQAMSSVSAMLMGGTLACLIFGAGVFLGPRLFPGNSGADPMAYTGGAGSSVNASSGSAIVQAVQKVGPAVMNVDTEFSKPSENTFLPDPSLGTQPQRGKGTGVVIDTQRGLMLTNAHVVAGAKKIQVTTRNGDQYSGRLLGSDRLSDIAVVVLSNKTLPHAKLAPIKDARKDLAIGEWAIAIGNPFAQANTVTVGVVSAVGRAIPVPGGKDGQGFQLTDMIQTDAAINPGNSGGPLCNIRGEVIGINTAIIPFGTGLGFTIPINKAMAVADQLIKNGRVQHPFVGIRMLPVTEAIQKDFGLPDRNGALVQAVESGSPAAKAGVQPGDVLRKADGKPIKNSDEIQRIVAGKKVGDIVKLEILRNNTVKKQLSLKIGDRPVQ